MKIRKCLKSIIPLIPCLLLTAGFAVFRFFAGSDGTASVFSGLAFYLLFAALLSVMTSILESWRKRLCEKHDSKKKNAGMGMVFLFVVLVLLSIGLLLVSVYAVSGETSAAADYGYGHAAACLICAFVFLAVEKWMGNTEDAYAATVCSLVAPIKWLCFPTALCIMLFQMWKTDFFFALTVLLRVVVTYVAVMAVLDLFVGLLQKSLRSALSLHIAAPMARKNSKRESLLDYLKNNTGISLKSLWSIRFFTSLLPLAALLLGVLLLASTCFVQIEPYQQGLIYRFGEMQSSVLTEGLHMKLPWPVEKVEIYDVERVSQMNIGYEVSKDGNFLWTQNHTGEEYKLLLGSGKELVSVNMQVKYKISDLVQYRKNYAAPEEMLNAAAYSLIFEKTIVTDLNSFLSADRTVLSSELKEDLNAYCAERKIGIQVENVVVESIHPPVEIANTYQGVVSAGIAKETLILQAQSKAAEKITQAETQKEQAVNAATAAGSEKLADAVSEISVYEAALNAYRLSPESFQLSKYLKTYETLINNHKVYIFDVNENVDLRDYYITSKSGSVTELPDENLSDGSSSDASDSEQ